MDTSVRCRSAWRWGRIALVVMAASGLVWCLALWMRGSKPVLLTLVGLFLVLVLTQALLGGVAVVSGIRQRDRSGIGAAAVGLLALATALVGGFYGVLVALLGASGGAWGRPLRVRGRQRHPELREGSDWTAGPQPSVESLAPATRAALEALWLHDAQKEHASVPAFARVSWLLAAVGAPADLLAWSHRAALEEIEHAQRCFALAAGYGGRSHTVEPMPELLLGGLDVEGDALVLLATESLADGCLLEDFNADVAAECAAVCEEPVTRSVLRQIAAEERSHGEFSWAVLSWALAHAPERVGPALERALPELSRYRRPTAVRGRLGVLVARADPDELRRHGRLPDERWAEIWQARLAVTVTRATRTVSDTLLRPA